ncbi:MAG: glycoside hydrolase family 3 protein [Firmicutes bacterium]|nr:glycoside hydrolase family 3 protein [Bacillota bacterium]
MIQSVIDRFTGSGLMQEENTSAGERYVTPGIAQLLRQAGAESCVLLENDGALPLAADGEVAVFGRCQLDWFYVGYGSGGDVKMPYTVNLVEGLQNAGVKLNEALLETYRTWTAAEDNQIDHGWWGHWPMHYPEMPLTDEIVRAAAETADTALVVIGRAAGEDRENVLEPGSYYLTDDEVRMLESVTRAFTKVVVLMNIGNIIDMSWAKAYEGRISALMIVWQSGMESGNSVADVLTGRVSPCGKLADTIAIDYEDYPSSTNFGGLIWNDYEEGIFVGYRHFLTKAPDRMLYPVGYGLSYTSFKTEPFSLQAGEDGMEAEVRITNTGERPGKEVVQVWCAPPREGLEKPVRVLCAFAKTRELAPGESETLTIRSESRNYASFDEECHAFVLDAGEYQFLVNDVPAGSWQLEAKLELEHCRTLCVSSAELRERILAELPAEIPAVQHGPHFDEVKAGRATLEDFVAGLSDKELEALSRGEGMMNSKLGVAGNAGAFGGVIESLRQKGVRPIITTDGPAGIRLQKHCALLPCGTALACTFNTGLIEALYAKVSEEMTHYGSDVLLAPGMNIHRNPLCGRNFEYFSEDPLLSGKMGAAAVRGIQSRGHAACPKHFACNNQEVKRNTNDSRVSERALREIYLRNFEICVREGGAKVIMTSYNKVNGVWSHYHYDLVTTILRGDWGYTGTVITDWWMRKSHSPEFPGLRDNAYRVRAQVDVLMPGDMSRTARKYRSDGTLLETLGKPGGITRGELQRGAMNVLRLLTRLTDHQT